MPNFAVSNTPVLHVNGARPAWELDAVAVEEPLEIRIGVEADGGPRLYHSVSVTMRTPGHDEELALGFLYTEGVIRSRADVDSIEPWGARDENGFRNIVKVDLRRGLAVDLRRMERHFYTSASCGVCGKAGLEQIHATCLRVERELRISKDLIVHLPGELRASQAGFRHTGGLHATALFDESGRLIIVREDVGRHNAMDKAIGHQLMLGGGRHAIALVSGRASFELVQKAAMARIAMLAAIGAPSTMAVRLAEECGITLIGFVRESRFNVYTGAARVAGLPESY